MIGKVLGSRYELIEKIGCGGMAVVYKAKCNSLNRYVAVKILKQDYISDEEFVKRFKNEALAAASLSHTNIVSVYDVGQQDDIYYIIMEYVDGMTLKSYIKDVGKMEWKEAAGVGIRVCNALKRAHSNNIIHRDIKPQNILLTSDGTPKVTDFGIAKAANFSTATVVANTIGSVHYSSPEQARGGYTDEKSDIYSMGITLYEMVTGKPPFDGDTAVTVAIKHLQDEMVPPKDINPLIPDGLNYIIMKATQKNKEDRYDSVSDMEEDIKKIIKFPDYTAMDFRNDEIDKFKTQKIEIGDDILRQTKSKNGSMDNKRNNAKKRKTNSLLLTFLLYLIVIGVMGFIVYKFIYPIFTDIMPGVIQPSTEFYVGDYVGRPYDEVVAELDKSGVGYEVEYIFNEEYEEGVVLKQSESPDTKMKVGDIVKLKFVVSKGINEIEITKDFKHENYLSAFNTIKFDWNLVPIVKEEYNEFVGVNDVIRIEPGVGTVVMPGDEIVIYKSLGPELKDTEVPDLVGKTLEEVGEILETANLKIGRIYPEDPDAKKGNVIIKQEPAALIMVKEDTAVHVYLEELRDEPVETTAVPDNNGETPDGINTIYHNVSLPEGREYGETVKLSIMHRPSDTDTSTILVNQFIKKSDFPKAVPIPVPEGGSNTIRVILDGIEIYTSTVR